VAAIRSRGIQGTSIRCRQTVQAEPFRSIPARTGADLRYEPNYHDGDHDRGRLIPQVGTVLPLENVRTAHEMLAGAPHKRGKIVLEMAV
jgi:hypothetical protein